MVCFDASFSCNLMPRSGYSALHGVNSDLKKTFESNSSHYISEMKNKHIITNLH